VLDIGGTRPPDWEFPMLAQAGDLSVVERQDRNIRQLSHAAWLHSRLHVLHRLAGKPFASVVDVAEYLSGPSIDSESREKMGKLAPVWIGNDGQGTAPPDSLYRA